MKRTKKELAKRKAKAAEIAALYNTVANGGRMKWRCNVSGEWVASNGPTLHDDLCDFRVIPAPRKPEPKKPEPRTWWLKMWKGCAVEVYPFDPVEMKGEWIKVREVQP